MSIQCFALSMDRQNSVLTYRNIAEKIVESNTYLSLFLKMKVQVLLMGFAASLFALMPANSATLLLGDTVKEGCAIKK